jgi:hypothetical protein
MRRWVLTQITGLDLCRRRAMLWASGLTETDQTVAGWRCSRWIHESRASLDSKLVISA